MPSRTRIVINREDCTSCAACWDLCPDVFEEDPDDHYSRVVEKFRIGNDPARGEVTADLADLVKEAAESCPVEIIHLEEIN